MAERGEREYRVDDRRGYDRRLAMLQNERSSWDSHWIELQNYILPRRGRFLGKQNNQGDRRNQKIIDNTATVAARTLASGMMAGITSPARPWFKLGLPDTDLQTFGPVKHWLHEVQRRMYTVYARSNFYNSVFSIYAELGVFGSAAMFQIEDFEDVCRFHVMTVGEYYLANAARGSVDTVYRRVAKTVSQLVEEFGKENCSHRVKEAWDRGNYDQWIDCIHAIEPNFKRDPGRRDNKNMQWVSVYYEVGSDGAEGGRGKVLRVSGFEMFPATCPRWDVTAGDVYGRSPAMDTLGDVKQLQVQQLRKAQGIDKMVNPPMQAPGSMKNAYLTTIPGDVTFYDGTPGSDAGFRPTYQVKPELQHLSLDIRETQERINRGLYADLFLMMAQSDRRQITAREIDERHEEKLIALGPVLERLQDEFLDPTIDRTFKLMSDAGVIPPAPPELEGMELKVEYVGLLAQAQKMIGVRSIEGTVGFVGNLAGVAPEAMDKIDVDAAIDEYGDALGAAPRIIRGAEQVAEIRQQRAQQQAAQQAVASALPLAQGAKTLSEADVGGENMLTRVLGG